MSSALASDEVAEDYKASLEDLAMNSRYEISNLTVIAKENAEHAMAISRVLENHIRKAPPSRKLPAMYVLDSIVKNIGSPYTLFLGRNLYDTFMNAYTLVDSSVRKKFDEMLKTWKEPVPGSMDSRPVFPPEITRQIENALIKARTAALQQHQYAPADQRTGTPPQAWRNTATPPQPAPGLPHHPQGYPQPYPPNGNLTPYSYPQSSTPLYQQAYPPQPSQHYLPPAQQHVYPPPPQNSVDLFALTRDIDQLILRARSDFANSPLDGGVQKRLQALFDLQSILKNGQLQESQLRQIRDQVSALTVAPLPKPTPPPQYSTPQPASLPAAYPAPQHTPQPAPQATPQLPPQANISSLLNSANLASLLKVTANRQQPTPPPPQPSAPFQQPQVTQTPPLPKARPAPPTAENPLIAQLRAAGILPGSTSTPPVAGIPPLTNSAVATPTLPFLNVPPGSAQNAVEVQLTSASLKIPRPHLISKLYEGRPDRCRICGRRFPATDEGKKRKEKHLDWHFKTTTRMAEVARRGQSRSWYVDERDWISSREYEDGEGPVEDTSAKAKKKQESYIPVPNDPALRSAPCPICQEKFEASWSEDVQEFIWRDAMKVGNRIYHASCYAEATKDRERGGTPMPRTGTPDSVLGKRKAEDGETNGIKTKIKTESDVS